MGQTNHYYSEMEAAGLNRRLELLSVGKLYTFGGACATHAFDIVFSPLRSQPGHSEYATTKSILDEFWERYPEILEPNVLAAFGIRARRFIENALGPEPDMLDRFTVPGAEALIWSTLYGVAREAGDDAIRCAENAADFAYRAVFYAFANDPGEYLGEQTQEYELGAPECLAELQFQLACLAAVEASNPYPSGYEYLCRATS